jgi:hypothetical protein
VKHFSQDDPKSSGLPPEPTKSDVKVAPPQIDNGAGSGNLKAASIFERLGTLMIWACLGAAIFVTLLWTGFLGWLLVRTIRILF